MNKLIFSYKKTCGVTSGELKELVSQLGPEIKMICMAREKQYSSQYSFVNVPEDKSILEDVKRVASEKKALNPKVLVVIGIGGSNLGAKALHESLNGILFNDCDPPMKVYFADTTDPDFISDLSNIIKTHLKNGDSILYNVVTKSGTTTETVANFEILLGVLREYNVDGYAKYIVITTDDGSKLWSYAQDKNISTLSYNNIGGRYSVLSAVGIFPLAMLGTDVSQLLAGARDMIDSCLSDDIEENIAAVSASILYSHYKKTTRINDIFIFSKNLRSLGLWSRMIAAESLGKEFDKDGNKVNAGILPTVSEGTTDLHTIAQFYLGGPEDMIFTTFVVPRRYCSSVKLPELDRFEKIVQSIQGKELSQIVDAVVEGVKKAYVKRCKPFSCVEMPSISPYSLGQFLVFKMFEVVYLGYFFNVDTFNQPSVEEYKVETRKNLSK